MSQDLQRNLDSLQSWENDWQMAFNPDKCEVIHITTKRKPIPDNYSNLGTVLNTTDHAKYLGVTSNFKHLLEKNTSITSPKKLIPSCPTSDEIFGPEIQAPSLMRTRHTFDPL